MVSALAAPLMLAFAPPPAPAATVGPAWPDFQAQVAAAKAAMMTEPQAALTTALSAMRLARARPPSADRDMAEAVAGWLEGEALHRVNRPADAVPVIAAALKQAQAVAPGSKLEGDLLKSRGWVAAAQSHVQPALLDFQRAFHVYEKAGVPRSQAIVLQDIGSIYSDARDFAHTISYYKQSGELYADDPALTLVSHNNLGGAYLGLGSDDQALTEFSLALKIAREMKSPSMLARVLPNLAEAQTRKGRFAEAEASLAEAFRLAASDPGAKAWTPFVWGQLAQVELKRGRPAEARAALERAFAGQDLAHTEGQFREVHNTAWRVYSALGDPAHALPHLLAFKRLDDQQRDLAASTNAALINAQFDFANQDLKISRLRAEKLQRDVALARSRSRAQNTLLATVMVAGGLVTALILAGFFAMRRSRNAVRAANSRLETTNAALERALKVKSQFLATTSHEIRTPLNGILGMTEVLLMDSTLSAAARDRVEVVHGSGQTMRALVDDILDLAKMADGRISVDKRTMNLRRLLDDAVRLWRAEAERKGLSLVLDAPDLPAAIVEDEGRLRQVVFNLMSNALKFTDRGGVTLRVRREGTELRVEVADTGVGIAPQDQSRVFEPFTQVDGGTTRRHGGTGLGLAICRDVTRALGGDITLDSRPGQGSRFTVRLPLVEAHDAPAAEAGPAAKRAPPASLSEACVLVVETNPLGRAVLGQVLRGPCASVEVADDLETALSMLGRTGFDQVVVSGEALGGLPGAGEAARKLVEAVAEAPVSVLVSSPAPELSAALVHARVWQLLERPITGDRLIEALAHAYVPADGLAVQRRAAA